MVVRLLCWTLFIRFVFVTGTWLEVQQVLCLGFCFVSSFLAWFIDRHGEVLKFCKFN